MKSIFKKNSGFTLIELIMVIVVLGFLAVIAIPEYVDLAPRARRAGEDGVAGGVRAGIATQVAKRASLGSTGINVYPPTLDATTLDSAVTDCSTIAAAPFCFEAVIPGGIKDSGWKKTSTTAYQGPNSGAYTYTSSTGQFA